MLDLYLFQGWSSHLVTKKQDVIIGILSMWIKLGWYEYYGDWIRNWISEVFKKPRSLGSNFIYSTDGIQLSGSMASAQHSFWHISISSKQGTVQTHQKHGHQPQSWTRTDNNKNRTIHHVHEPKATKSRSIQSVVNQTRIQRESWCFSPIVSIKTCHFCSGTSPISGQDHVVAIAITQYKLYSKYNSIIVHMG